MSIARLAGFLATAFVVLFAAHAPVRAADPENTIYLDLKYGRVVIELLPDLAPAAVARIKKLTREGFYDGLKFHRALEGFMAQTGDPLGTGEGGSSYPDLPDEFSDRPFVRGTVGMARTPAPNSANSQFFIVYGRPFWLDGEYTLFGRVIEGMEFVDKLKKGREEDDGLVRDPDIIVKMQVAADAK